MTTIVIRAITSHYSHRVIETREYNILVQRWPDTRLYVVVGYTHGDENRDVNFTDPEALQVIVDSDVVFEHKPELLNGL